MNKEEMKKGVGELPLLLLSIAECYPPVGSDPVSNLDALKSELSAKINHAKDVLSAHDLDDIDVIVVAILLEYLLDGKASISATDVASRISADKAERYEHLQASHELQQKGIISIEAKGFKIPAGAKPQKYPLTLAMLVQAELQLSTRFLDEVFGTTSIEASSALPYSTNQEYLDDWFVYVDALRKIRCLKDWELDGIDRAGLQDIARSIRTTIECRLAAGITEFPLDKVVSEYKLDETERDLLLYLLMQELRDETPQVSDVTSFLTAQPFDRVAARRLLEPNSRLRSNRIIEVEHDAPVLYRWLDVTLNPAVAGRLLNTDSATVEDRLQHVLKNQSIFKIEKAHQTLDDVVLPASLLRTLMTGIKRYEAGVDSTLRAWGLERSFVQDKPGELDEAPLLVLLSGPSGTGKTLTAGAIANHLDKALLTTDISKLLSCWVGESERNVRRMLDIQAEIVRTCPNPPVFFLNECDQFLQNRGLIGSGVSRMYNQMQNLLLEGFERMRGVLIATTNLTDNIDEAFSRRFHLKLEIGKPDLTCRKKLWEKHLLPTIPRAEDVDTDRLATMYEFTGGQVAVVVRNAAVEAAVRGDMVHMADLVAAAEIENNGAMDHSAGFKGQLGFRHKTSGNTAGR